ncbi:MAG: amidohydrolase family protein [Clostridia bacterium]|nr:amidohydrolase family protein [Clostridia bacterium]
MFNLIVNDYDKYIYEEELLDFIPSEIFDCHIHMWKNTFKPHGSSNGGATWTKVMADEMTAEQMFDAFEKLFPKNKVSPLVFAICTHEPDEENGYVAEMSKKYNFPALYRTEYLMSPDKLEEDTKYGGFIGFKPYLTSCPPYIPIPEIRTFDFLPYEHLEVANRNGWIVMLHIARSKRLRDELNIAQLMEIEEKFPNVKLVVAHIGRAYSKQDIGDAFDILKNTQNMMFDFTANVCDDAIKACIEAVGTKRLMFGSDLPVAIMRMFRTTDETGFYYNNVPRGLYGDKFEDSHMKLTDREDVTLMIYEQILALKRVAKELKLSDSAIEDIMYGNAKRLIDGVK